MSGNHVPGERLYRLLLRCYPADFRARYGEAMAEFYRDRWRAERAAGRAAPGIWWRVLVDAAASASAERAAELGRRMQDHGNDDTIHEDETMWTLRQDLRYALRGMRRRPGFTAVVLATLALGIGANAAIFTVVNAVLFRALPYANVAGIVDFAHHEPYSSVSEPEFADYLRDMKALSRLAAIATNDANLTGGSADQEAERVRAARVSDGFFAILGVPPAHGRTFTPDEDKRGAPPVVIISYGLWQRRFGGDPGIVGKEIVLNGTPRTVVGVMPAHFDFPSPQTSVWTPLRLNMDSLWTRNNHYLRLVGRLAPGATASRASAEANALSHRWMTDYPDIYFPGKPLTAEITPLRDRILGSTRPYLLALLGAVGFVLLIACVNVANLLLARGEGRRKELAIRTALGASRRQLVRQLLTESALLALAGGALGLLLAWWGGRALVALAPSTVPRLGEVHVDLAVLAFTLGVSLATGLLFGLVPALRAAREHSAETLKEGGKTSAQGSGGARVRRALVVTEVALAVVTLAGAGLLVRSLLRLQAVDLGFDRTSVLTMRLSPPPRDYQQDARIIAFYRELLTRVRALPGVRRVAAMEWAPVAGDFSSWSIMVDGRVVKNISEAPSATPEEVTPGYFETMGIPIRRGRTLGEGDREGAPPVAVINETMAKQLWPGQDPLGHTFKMFGDQAPWVTVVGVARDVRSSGPVDDPPPTFYVPHAQSGVTAYYTPLSMMLAVRTAGDPMALANAVRQAVHAIDRNVPVSEVRTLDDAAGASIASRRFSTLLLAGFAALALLLAGIGIYGVISYGVSQRTFEIGLRMALGAQRRSVLGLVLSDGMRMALAGLALGLAGALAVTRLIRSLLVGVGTADLPTLALTSLALAGVALLASALPARRAMGVNPTEALRGE